MARLFGVRAPAGRARARRSLNAHPLFVIRRLSVAPLPSFRRRFEPSTPAALLPQSKLSLYYQARGWNPKNLVLCV